MARNRRLTFVVLLAVVAIPVFALAVWRFVSPLHRDPPKVIGVELGPNGKPNRQIVFDGSYRVSGWLPDPEGGHQTRIKYSHFFLETPGAPRQELKFLLQVLPDSVIITDLCHPVQNTSLWISAGFFQPGSQINVVVFDQTGVRAQRTIAVAPDDRHPGHDFWFENGNSTLRFRSAIGVGTYDVATDTVAP
jgi:hypothetical protein